MAKVRVTDSSPSTKKTIRSALTPEAREGQLISLAVDLAETQLRDGTASSQVITHFLKLATAKAKLETEKLKLENKLTEAKTKQIESTDNSEELYKKAVAAMTRYKGLDTEEEEFDDED